MKHIFIVGGLIIGAFFVGRMLSSPSSYVPTPQVQGIAQEIFSVSPQQFNDSIQTNEYVVLDVRTADEYAVGHLKNSKQVDYYQTQAFSNYLDTLDKNAKYLIYCRTGKRSGLAIKIMQEKGFSHVNDLAGGYTAWESAGLPTEK
jgi:rhodanese-related sulfurtransferase